MDVVFGLIPLMLFFGFLVVVVFIWMAKTGHFDDLDGAANSIFMDDEYEEDKSPLKSKEKEINQETSAKQSEKQ
ncbi:MAG TPA: cbb3-type cytochrome oxidase assembly protein CcoS, partial [Thiomicrospira sp.]|nr:cbb3-type cytochrome oxidase assembly protein CcoS [Thiomicrospira sp.]